ncbi:MAG: sulfur carrier protein ThiS [Deltaproteobacteria bacterium]|nr:sulfur carrier protein ThiS [Deltaproteobacteria bacterium]
MNVTINGEKKIINQGTKIRDLVIDLLDARRALVIEINGMITSDFDTALSDGDTVEIVTFVGGG